MPQEGSRHPGEGDFHQVEPGGMLGRVHVLEAARMLGDMVIEHDADEGRRWDRVHQGAGAARRTRNGGIRIQSPPCMVCAVSERTHVLT